MVQKTIAASVVLSALAFATAQQTAPPAVPDDLAKAIAEMRNLPEKLTGKESDERGPRIQAAWETLIAAKDAGATALLAEAARLDATKQKDDRFRLGAAAVVWQIGRFDRVADVVTLWGNADFAVKYTYAFLVGFDAARDGDERALPLLVALLRDQRGRHFVADHVMDLGWPLTHDFLWGPMGRKAVPALEKVLATAKDPTVVSSAIELLAGCWDVATLPRLRAVAGDAADGARTAAIRVLGRFGHPNDFEFLCAGLADRDPRVASAHVNALCAFGDLRAVPRLLPLLTSSDQDLRLHALGALGALATVDGLEAFAGVDKTKRGMFAAGPPQFHALDVSWDAYQKLDRAERGKVLAKARAKVEDEFRLQEGDRKLTHEEFESACKSWIAASRISDEEHSWIESRHVLAAVTPADVPLLLDVRGRVFRRLSDECLEEVGILDKILSRLVRSQYRAEPGVCEQVKPVGKPVTPAKGESK
jgi:HEAT repeat protein